MKKNFKKIFGLTMMIFMLSTTFVFASEFELTVSNAEEFGIFTLIPPIVAILLAFITKNVVISLFIGVLSGGFILNLTGFNVFGALTQAFLDFIDRALNSLSDPWNAGIVMQVLVIGGVINLVAKMGGAKAIAEALAKKAKTAKSAQLITWFLGICVFFDDYANSLIVGPIMRPVADKMKISRERLAFIIDATAAPIAGLAIISTWIGLEVSLISEGFESIGVEASGFGVFLQTIPYRFYNILILAFIVITIITLREFGPMRKAEISARKLKDLTNEEIAVTSSHMDELEPKEGVKLSIWNAIVPIGALIISAIVAFYYSGYSSIMAGDDIAIKAIITNSPLSFKAILETFAAS
ncbi:Na+/H+ antiporter NhaC family protein, partial [Clostridium sp. CAG:221]|uniref:Na+/H+ antiporter NhaC family protein n=1 Tax=Clostridium sp. CAG:221 TaxID=1262780 RepID=UPI000B11B41C